MDPDRAAVELEGELRAALADAEAGPASPRVRSVAAPPDLGADRTFLVTLSIPGSEDHIAELPAPLAMGYLADEEAAVDEWKSWVADLSRRLTP